MAASRPWARCANARNVASPSSSGRAVERRLAQMQLAKRKTGRLERDRVPPNACHP
jgi:hypothetical protein